VVEVGEKVRVKIIGLTPRGNGWGMVGDKPIIVPFTAVGATYIVEVTEVYPEYCVGKAVKRLY